MLRHWSDIPYELSHEQPTTRHNEPVIVAIVSSSLVHHVAQLGAPSQLRSSLRFWPALPKFSLWFLGGWSRASLGNPHWSLQVSIQDAQVWELRLVADDQQSQQESTMTNKRRMLNDGEWWLRMVTVINNWQWLMMFWLVMVGLDYSWLIIVIVS